MEHKYVIIDGRYPVLFPSVLEHRQFGRAGVNITSAGFFTILQSGDIQVFGESQTLHLHSHPEDEFLIKLLLRKERY